MKKIDWYFVGKVAYFIFSLALLAGSIYVAWHFIAKYW